MKIFKKDYQYKEPKQKITTFEEFSKRWRAFLKVAKIENWNDDCINYLMEKYQ